MATRKEKKIMPALEAKLIGKLPPPPAKKGYEPQPAPTIDWSVSAAKKSNGPKAEANKPSVPAMVDPRSSVHRGLAEFDTMQSNIERLEDENKHLREKVTLLELQLREVESTRNTIESRVNDCLAQRDQAVTEAGELRGALKSVAAICVRYHDEHQG